MTVDEIVRDPEARRRAEALATPDGYAREFLGMNLHPVQAAALCDLFNPKSRVVLRCANEVGKTRRVVTAAVLYACHILEATAVSTAGVFRQVSEQLIPSLKSYSNKYPKHQWQFLDRAIKRYDPIKQVWIDCYTGFSAKDENYFQGYHRDEGTELLIIIDESQGVADEIFKAAEDRCNPSYFLAAGSPGDPAGMFYRMETDLAAHYSHHRLTRPECTIDKGWWIDPADIQRMIDKYGADNPFVRSTVFGEFSTIVEGALLSLGEYERCLENAPPVRLDPRDKHAFCDFAGGRDKNVLAVRVGNKCWIEKKWVERDTMAAVGEFVALFTKLKREYGFEPTDISGDADGLGLPMIDRLHEVGWTINRFHGGGAPTFDDGYKNATSEAWGEGAAKIKRAQIVLTTDLDLKGQCLGRKTRRNSSGKMELESKEEMRRRGLSSPDEADAVFGCLMPAPVIKAIQVMGTNGQSGLPTRKEDVFKSWDVEQDNAPSLPGAHFG